MIGPVEHSQIFADRFSANAGRESWAFHRMLRIAEVAHWFLVVGALVHAFAGLAVNPNVDRAILLYFVPPLIACLFLATDGGKFNPSAIRGCQLFLTTIAVAVFLGEHNVVLPNLRPQFAGMPAQADRVLTFYFAAYALFLGVACPAYVLGSSLYLHARGLPGGMSRPILYAGCVCWIFVMAVLAVALVISIVKNL